MTNDEVPLDIVLQALGGLALAAFQIARAIRDKGQLPVFMPHHAMSAGTLISLAADEIVMSSFHCAVNLHNAYRSAWPASTVFDLPNSPFAGDGWGKDLRRIQSRRMT